MMRRPGERGASMIELLIATTIMTIVFMSVTRVLVRTQVGYEYSGSTINLRQSARLGLNRMVNELRMAGYGLSGVSDTFTTASAVEVSFASDIDDGALSPPCTIESGDDGVEHVTYRISTGLLERRVECWSGGSWVLEQSFQPITDQVENAESNFTYFDAVGNQIGASGAPMSATLRNQIRRVRITLALVDSAPELPGMPASRYRAATDVAIRNFFDGGAGDGGGKGSGKGK